MNTILLSSFTYFFMLLFVGILLRSKRTPASTLAWLGMILLAPYLGIPLFLTFGRRKFKKIKLRPPSPVCQNQKFIFLDSGESAYTCLMDGIRGAQKTIDLAVFIFSRDEVGKLFLDELTLKAKQGVRIRILVDALGSSLWVRPSFKEFKKAGGRIAFFLPLLKGPFRGLINLRNHRKLAIIDGQQAWTGGMNLASEYLGPAPLLNRWADLAVWIEGEAVNELQTIFDSDWAFATHEKQPTPQPENAPKVETEDSSVSQKNHLIQMIASGPDIPEDPLYDSLLEACFEARERIWIITPYFIPDECLIKALELACKRRVDVRILIPAHSNHFFADLSRGSYIRQLLSVGGKVYRYPKMMHTKLTLVDDQFALIGSANFDLRSLFYNCEIGIFLFSQSEVLWISQWAKELYDAGKEGYPKATPFRELVEGLGRVYGPLL